MKKRTAPILNGDTHFRAILFDFDGVLADTMEDNYRAWVAAFEPYGIDLWREEFFRLEGMNVLSLAKKVLATRMADTSKAQAISVAKERRYAEHHHFRFYAGIEKMIADLRDSYALGLVSGAGRKRLEETVPREFLEAFSAIVTGDDVRKPKPDAEPYLKAAAILKIAPRDCLVVENAPLGIAAAKKAGMYCVAICTTLPPEALAQADQVLNDHRRLREMIADPSSSRIKSSTGI